MSEYLSCVGFERFVVQNVESFQQAHPRLAASTSKKKYVRSLHDDINKRVCEASFFDVEQIVRRCESKGWVEWTRTTTGNFCLCRTELGWKAYGLAANGTTPAMPESTITTIRKGMHAILKILLDVKQDPNGLFKGDPRVNSGKVIQLQEWVAQLGVPHKLYVEALDECKAEVLVVATAVWLGEVYSITSRGRDWLGAGRRKHEADVGDNLEAVEEQIHIRADAGLAHWNGRRLDINSHADFAALQSLLAGDGAIVAYSDLLRTVKPTPIDQIVRHVEAPSEVKEAASHIRKALKTVGCPWQIENVRNKGYRLLSPDE